MAIADIALKVAAEEAVLGIEKHYAPLTVFAHSFKELESRPGAAIAVPVFDLSAAADYNASTNNWGSGEDINGLVVTVDKHLIKSIQIDDVTAGDTDVNFLRDGARAITEKLAHAANAYTFGLLQNVTVSADVDLSSKQDFADLFAVADANGINPYESVLVLNPAKFSVLLGQMDALVYGGNDGVKRGVIPGLFGFQDVVCSPYLPDGDLGAIIPYGTIGVASRVNKPAINGYVSTWTASDDNGIAIGFRVYEDLAAGVMKFGGDQLFGAKLLQPEHIVRLR